MKLCDYYAGYYKRINRDLLLTAALFHDIGKTKELSCFPENDYTDDGQLLGHIVIGAEMVGERIRQIPGFPDRLATELKHCILALSLIHISCSVLVKAVGKIIIGDNSGKMLQETTPVWEIQISP